MKQEHGVNGRLERQQKTPAYSCPTLNKRKKFKTIISNDIKRIHQETFRDQLPQEIIPCNCFRCKNHEDPETYPMDTINNYIKKKRSTIECRKSMAAVPIIDLVGEVYTDPPSDSHR